MIPVTHKGHKGFFHSIASGFRDIDIFGRPVGLKFKNRYNSNSVVGGCFTLFIVAGISLYFALLVTMSRDNTAKIT